ncbi:MAG: hypothetical protein M3Y13_14980, partial [Armatimonadota bacterium]|nr:hypothetical protein [Armatimonadota bacterium]
MSTKIRPFLMLALVALAGIFPFTPPRKASAGEPPAWRNVAIGGGFFRGDAPQERWISLGAQTFHALAADAPSAPKQEAATEAVPLPVAVNPTNPLVRLEGRFDLSDAAGPRCSWPASAVELKFKGSALN